MTDPASTSDSASGHEIRPRMHAAFSADFWPVEVEGTGDSEEISLLLTTLCRSGDTVGESFSAGPLLGAFAWSNKGGIRLVKSSDGYTFDSWENVADWADINAEWRETPPCPPPVVANHREILDGLPRLPALAWCGIRNRAANQWEERRGAAAADDATKPREGAMNALQIDALLKGQEQPRGRLCLLFANGSFWAWADNEENYLMAFIAGPGGIESQLGMIHFGEAFLIRETGESK